MRLIDAEKLGLTDFEIAMCDGDYKEALKMVLGKIEDAPTVDAEPVRHGRWLKNGDRYCECSVCHHEGNTSGADNYCPNCGAKMDVETGNTYSIGEIELPIGVFRQIYDEERKEDETD